MKKRKKLSGALLMAAALVIMTLPVSEADAATSASDFMLAGSTSEKNCTQGSLTAQDGQLKDRGQILEQTVTLGPRYTSASAQGEDELLGSSSVVGNRAFVFWNTKELDVIEQASPNPGLENEAASLISGLASTLGNMAAGGVVEHFPKYTVVDGEIVADEAFYRNETLAEVTLSAGIQEIGQFSFARSSLEKIELPEGVTDICYGAFYHCDRLAYVELPESVMNVEPEAFAHTAWMENFLEGGADFLISGSVLVAYSGSDTEVSVPGGVRVIAAGAFAGHEEIRTVRIPDSVLVIGEAAFENCTGLQRVNLGGGVEQIKDRAFLGCSSLEALSVPASVQSVGLQAFGTAEVIYRGNTPAFTYEVSATRLVNDSYRGLKNDNSRPQVTVTGTEPSAATLEGAKRSYTLTVERQADIQAMERAWKRIQKSEMPDSMEVFALRLTDSSNIPIAGLGRSGLTVVLPVPEALAGQELGLVTMDRNGQLEALGSERVLYEGTECIRFRTTYVSAVGVYGKGPAETGTTLREVSVGMSSMSRGPSGEETALRGAKFLVGAAVFVTGLVVFLQTGARRRPRRR